MAIKQLLEQTICISPSESCYYRQYDDCRHLKASDILSDGIGIEIHDSASWFIWKKMNVRYELLHLTGAFQALMEEIDDLSSNFITHSFYTHKQRYYIALIKEISSSATFAVAQLDFAQNFSFVIQREVQSVYYSRQQAAILRVYIKVGEEHRDMVFISDYLTHDTRFVYCAKNSVVDFLRKEYHNVIKVNYVSDGASAHFKSKCSTLQTHGLEKYFPFYEINTICVIWLITIKIFISKHHGLSAQVGMERSVRRNRWGRQVNSYKLHA